MYTTTIFTYASFKLARLHEQLRSWGTTIWFGNIVTTVALIGFEKMKTKVFWFGKTENQSYLVWKN